MARWWLWIFAATLRRRWPRARHGGPLVVVELIKGIGSDGTSVRRRDSILIFRKYRFHFTDSRRSALCSMWCRVLRRLHLRVPAPKPLSRDDSGHRADLESLLLLVPEELPRTFHDTGPAEGVFQIRRVTTELCQAAGSRIPTVEVREARRCASAGPGSPAPPAVLCCHPELWRTSSRSRWRITSRQR